jgi:hypothetical protein
MKRLTKRKSKRGIATQCSVDAVEVCYRTSQERIEWMTEITVCEFENIHPSIPYLRLSDDDNCFDYKYIIKIEVMDLSTNELVTFGRYKFGKKKGNKKQTDLICLSINNRIFYPIRQ